MSDKSFGDHSNRNVVKNSLLSSAVIGLSLEDLTHKAVFLPASPSQGQVARSDQQQGSQAHTLAHSDHDKPSFPSGDAFSNISLSNTPPNPQSKLDSGNNEKITGTRENTTASQSKASVKSEDDFDVNEYIARLQGTRYVSAPLHSHLKEDQNVNLGAEEALEEINLNESRSEPVQQSLTADIAQNFSQLPAVLPHVASAVFSSFSNMLSMKSREQTPDKTGYQEVEPDAGVPLMGVEESTPKDFGLPPKEPPVAGTSNYRISSKKKYAQIPGLSYGATQNMYQNPITPFSSHQQIPFTPEENRPESVKQNTSLFTPANTAVFKTDDVLNTDVDKAQIAVNASGIQGNASIANVAQESQSAPIDYKDITTPRVPIIPPPPMFSNPRTSQGAGKSVLPPSVARRISANQPLIKPSMPTPVFSENIFVPTIPDSVHPETQQFADTVNPSIQPHLNMPAPPIASSVPLYSTPPNIPALPVGSFFTPKSDSVETNVGFFTPSESSKPTAAYTPSSLVTQPIGGPSGSNNLSSYQSSQPSLTSIGAPIIGANIHSPERVIESNAPSSVSQPLNTAPFVPMFASQANIPPTSIQPLSSIGTPSANVYLSDNIPASTSQSSDASPFVPMFASPAPPSFFTPETPQDPITQTPGIAPDPAKKPLVEPPKATGLNFRMTKKRPQYYSGPIEGVGAISNNVKPIIASAIPAVPDASFQASFFTPDQKDHAPTIQASTPFDISKPVEPVLNVEPKAQALDINPQYNTAFDLSRTTTEAYEPPKQEPKGFGIIGSLKSKLSSIDINKIQSTVTTFFDPAYNVAKGEPALETAPYTQQQYGQYSQEQSNFELTVPSDQNQYSQFGYQQGYNYDQSNQYYQAQNAYHYQNQGQNASSYFAELSYQSQQVYNPALDTNFQEYTSAMNYTQENIPQNVANISDNMDKASIETQGVFCYNPVTIQKSQVESPQPSFEKPKTTDVAAHYVSPNVGSHGAIGDVAVKASVNPPTGIDQGFKHALDPTPKAASFFDNPLVGADETKPKTNNMTLNANTAASTSRAQFDAPLPPAMSFFDSPIASAEGPKMKTKDLADEMEKLAMAEEIAIAQSPFQGIDLQIGVNMLQASASVKSVDHHITAIALDKNVQNYHINKEADFETDLKSISLIESLSKDTTPVVTVSNVPLFGLSAVIDKKDKPIEKFKNDCLYEASKDIKPILEKQTSFSLFENSATENKDFEESTNAFGLSMSDVKNVLLFEPPQDSLGVILQRTASSSLLKDLPTEVKSVQNLSEDKDMSWNLDASMVTSKDNVNLLFDRKASGFFDHLMSSANPVEETVKVTDAIEQASDFNICETCREVNSPELKGTDNVTNKLIENMNSSIQLSNPVEVDLTESIPTASDRAFEEKQFDDINRITEDTIETLQGQSAAELLDDVSTDKNYGWNTEQLAYASIAAIDKEFVANTGVVPTYSTTMNPEYTFKNDPNAIGFFGDNSMFFDNVPKNANDERKVKPIEETIQKVTEAIGQTSDLNICETCREVNSPEIKRTDNVTNKLIKNINSSIQLSNSVEVGLTEGISTATDRAFEEKQFDDINRITEDTIETLQGRSAAELLDDDSTIKNYAWNTEQLAYASKEAIDKEFVAKTSVDPSYSSTMNPEYTIDPNAIEFFGDNSMFFDNVPKNASDEIKAELKTHEDIVPRQMSIPSAPPEEDDTKSDETGCLDVLSIEQDAKKDFPLEEEFIIEPSETDDDKIEFRERKRSSEDSAHSDTFADRIEKFKNKAGVEFSSNDDIYQKPAGFVPPKSMASYFDTGNYAVETHYRKSLTSPSTIDTFQERLPANIQEPVTNVFKESYNKEDIANYIPEEAFRLPPGFEDEIRRQFLGQTSSDNKEPFIPETSTQTNPTVTTTYNIASGNKFYTNASFKDNKPIPAVETKTNVLDIQYTKDTHFKLQETNIKAEKEYEAPTLEKAFGSTNTLIKDHTQAFAIKPNTAELIAQKNLPDPINFFAQDEPKERTEAPESFSRLASYFSMPPAQPDHSKSFFELSQSQNHYRHVESNTQQGQGYDSKTIHHLKNLMRDLTSTQNIHLDDKVVTTVNYSTVEYKNVGTSIPKLEHLNINTNNDKHESNNLDSIQFKDDINIDTSNNSNENSDVSDSIENDDLNTISTCKYCCNTKLIDVKDYKVRTAADSEIRKERDGNMSEKDNSNQRKSVSVDLGHNGMDEEAQAGVTVVHESRSSSEYSPVRHHWFYRVDVDDKSLWRGFSTTDSDALEQKYLSPELNDDTLVPTDGGRFDVNIVGRLRIAIYWKEKPTNVRRCSWFYKGTTDARYVPYTEAVADKLEEEYRHGVTTGEWHRRLVLPNSELVVMHGPAVMVHFLHGGADSFSSPPFLLGKRVYRNPPKIRVARDLRPSVDHLILVVHGAGEYKREQDQTTSRPRVVRRGYEESEIEDPEPSSIDHLLLLCHGVGSACDMRFRPVEEVVEDFRSTSLQLLQSHYRNSYDNGIVSRVEVLPISWHAQLHVGENGVDKRLNKVTLESIPRLRAFTNHTVLDALFYTSPVYHQTIIDTVCFELNRIYNIFKQRNPSFKGGVSLGGHSLGSVILYDLLCHQKPEKPLHAKCSAQKTYLPGSSQPLEKYPQLQFPPAALYALGSPIAIFECIRGVEALGMDFALPTCKNFFNIFHPYDPIAYRIEPLINPQLQGAKPFLIPHHKGRKRMHLELKDTVVRVGADLKQKLIESLRTTWNKWKATPPPDGQLEKVVEEELEKEQLCDETKEEVNPELGGVETLGALNAGRRVDYVLQEAPLEMINEYLFAMSSHVGYWESEDTMLLMLREIYSSLGVQPDCTVPQQSMTVTRTTRMDEATIINEKECPSTSRGSC